ncbi:MAG: ABC transporter ATP-binding protein [Gemmatimonadota bacterium]|jgi:lipoprotein-releasing system ATP-binding protein|nr:ABC transporter ATP-binding protein [Gemmatimonadota bacterium]
MSEHIEGQGVITAENVRKSYVGGDGSTLEVLTGVDLVVRRGETVAIIGESGSGKSTLLHILGGLDTPSEGELWIGDERLRGMDENRLGTIRNRSIGFVFQFHHLLREFSVLENVMMPQLIAGCSPVEAADRARELLGQVGLERRVEHRPMQLSGGEQQRAAVARALANRPLALLADEPSGNLDPDSSERLHDLLFGISAASGTAMILVTHNMRIAVRSDRVLQVREGQLVVADERVYRQAGSRPE